MQKACKQCQTQFQLSEDDLKFYAKISPKFGDKKIGMPSPNLCIGCRQQRRLAFRNEMSLYHRKCDSSGKQLVSMYSPDKPLKVYDQHIWWSDSWDPMEFGQDFNFSRPFFEQFKELQAKVPRMCVNNINNENSDYGNLAYSSKNCYMTFTADFNEDSGYLRFATHNFRCFDSDYIDESTDCYECIDMEKCNGCKYSHKCINSSALCFSYNMIGCHDCIGCANLRNKQYYIFNESCDREEFEKKKEGLKLNTYSGFKALQEKYIEFLKKQPRKYLEIVNSENSIGDYLRDCRNAKLCYNSNGLEDCSYMMNCMDAKDCYDWSFVGGKGSELCHEMGSSAYGQVNCHFCNNCWENNNELYYSELCLNSKYLFGCIALRHKEYCVLNKQYKKEEYEELVPRIIDHMINNGEWGEFFPMDLSAYAYNETVAHEFFPLTNEEVEKRGWRWHDDEEKVFNGQKYEIPDDIKDVPDKICEEILTCEKTGKPYKIIPLELKFCKMLGVPAPRISPRERHVDRMALRNPWPLWARKCDKCGVDIKTTYSPDRPEPVYCEKCYHEAMY